MISTMSMYITLVCLLALVIPTAYAQQCDTITASAAPYCSSYVTYTIPRGWQQQNNDQAAQAASVPLVDQSVNCPYYDTQAYQCRKHFPRCVPGATSTDAPTTVLMCYSNCMAAQTYNHNTCGAQAQYTQSYFDNECGQTQYYSAPTTPIAQCDNYPSIASNDSNQQLILKAVLGSVFGALGLVIAVYTIYKIVQHRKLKKKLKSDQSLWDAQDIMRIANIDRTYDSNRAKWRAQQNHAQLDGSVAIPEMPEHFGHTVVLTPSDVNASIAASAELSPVHEAETVIPVQAEVEPSHAVSTH